MSMPARSPKVVVPTALLCSLAAVALAGCQTLDQSAWVQPVTNAEVVALDADDVVRIMQRAGFSDRQVLDLGTDVRNALAVSGSAKVRVGEKVEAIFAAVGRTVQATTRRRGGFIYNVDTQTTSRVGDPGAKE